MIDHVSVQCADLTASATFYDSVLAPLGGSRVLDFETVIGFGTGGMPEFILGPQQTGTGFRETHLAFTAPSRAAVREFFAAAVQAGAEVLHAPSTTARSSATPTATTSRPSATPRNSARH
jgi:catechol 2,3-dioxygenase-like lactoylglutathione lyase family enzyme